MSIQEQQTSSSHRLGAAADRIKEHRAHICRPVVPEEPKLPKKRSSLSLLTPLCTHELLLLTEITTKGLLLNIWSHKNFRRCSS